MREKIIQFKNSLVLDLSEKSSWFEEFKGCTLDFRELEDDHAIVITNTKPFRDGEGYLNSQTALKELHILGPGRGSDKVGVYMKDAPFFSMENCAIEGFEQGIYVDKACWCNHFANLNVFRCDTALEVTGCEVITLTSCVLFNSRVGLKMWNGHLAMHGCSIDYNSERVAELYNSSLLELFGCHIETGTHWIQFPEPSESMVYLERHGGYKPTFRMVGGIIHIHDGKGALSDGGYNKKKPIPNFFDNNGGLVDLEKVRLWNVQGNALQKGNGEIRTSQLDAQKSVTKHRYSIYDRLWFVSGE